jgi:hypothetical protein
MGGPALIGFGAIRAVARDTKINHRRDAAPRQHPAHGNRLLKT